jgi:hypothetical protein
LTFIANFTTPNQNPSSIVPLVQDFLALEGFTSVMFLGRAGDSSTFVGGDSITLSGGNQSGTFSFSPGTTGDVAAFVAIHAGNGQNDGLFAINSPGLSGTWGTNNGHDLSNFDLFGCPVSSTTCGTPTRVPEPASLFLFGSALAGLGILRRRRRSTVA